MSPTPKPVRTAKVHALTHIGEVRTRNEDAIALSVADDLVISWDGEIPLDGGWALLADGMGGHVAGEVASALAIAVLRPLVNRLRSETDIAEACDEANRGLHLAMQMRPELVGMGTTIAGVILRADHAVAFNIGDSRIHVYADGRLRQLSADHAIERQLTQCLGGAPVMVPMKPTVVRFPLTAGAVILVSSDGLTDMLSHDELQRLLSASPSNPATACVRHALDAGGFDNVSVIALSLQGETLGEEKSLS